MGATSEVKLPIVDSEGRERGTLSIRLLPNREAQTLLDLRLDPDRPRDLDPVQLMEGQEYRFTFSDLPPEGKVAVEPAELFYPDQEDGRSGRLRTGLYTGTVPVRVFLDQQELGRLSFEVRSRKLDYLRHYQWMLGDIAERLTEALMERFAPAERRFALDETKDAKTLYQRFAFLKHLLSGDAFEAAMHRILASPHRLWIDHIEERPPGMGAPAGSGIGRQVASSPGPRIPWQGGVVPYMPSRMQVRRTEETQDTPENRFVRFALTYWRDIVADVGSALAASDDESGTLTRGRREVAAVVERLDELLSDKLFREVGPMRHLPAESQILQKRVGYREIFRAFVQFEAAAAMEWNGGEDVYSAGQRNVATLYEYWVFLQLSHLIGSIANEGFTEKSLFKVQAGGLTFALKQGRQRLVTGVASRHGRRIRLELWYNRRFGSGNGTVWTLPMHPDVSLRIRPEVGAPAPFEEIWLHFDAKYRIEGLQEIFNPEPNDQHQAGLPETAGAARRDDLLKMHAYRDAIRRSAGAYILYPGFKQRQFTMYHELLPGLGAFALRPSEEGAAEGIGALRQFLEDVLDHVASQATQHERERWWVREVHADQYWVTAPVPAAPFLQRPPADTVVLLGYFKNQRQLNWIHTHRLYNVRADNRTGSVQLESRELSAELLVLYNPWMGIVELWRTHGTPILQSGTQMRERGYPEPHGRLYYCLQMSPIPEDEWPKGLTAERVERLVKRTRRDQYLRAPTAVSWLALVRSDA